MLVDRVADLLALVQLQRALSEFGTGKILLTLALGVLVLIAVDYSWMLYLHFKMVIVSSSLISKKELESGTSTDHDRHSLRGLFPFPSLAIHGFYQRISLGSTLKSSPKITTLH